MTLREIRRHVGRLLFAGFAGPVVSDDLRRLAREFDLGGVVLFARNVVEPSQVAELSRAVAELSEEPPWVAVDQEGGRVARLRAPFTEWPPMATLGRAADEALARRFARALASELAAVGITLDFAPVLDVHTNPANPVIGDRALSDRADEVARLGRAIIDTLQEEGLAACGKHFPGHGDTSVDSHLELPLVEHALDRLRAVELVPFRAAIEAGVAFMMTAHVLVPALDDATAATFSKTIVDGLLRRELGFTGAIVTDDLDMQAARDRGPGEAAVAAVAAGCDGLLFCSPDPDRQVRALEGLVRAVESGALAMTRIEEAIRRLRQTKERFRAGPARDGRSARPVRRRPVGAAEHLAVAEEMGRYL